MGMSTIQAHHAWGYHFAAEETKLPPSKGGHVKIYKGRVYIGFALIDDPEEIGKREPEFGKLVEYCVDNWENYYQKYIKEVISNLDTLNGVDTDKLIFPHLLEHLRRAERLNRRNWEIHFILMYPADAVYFMFEDYCKKLGTPSDQLLEKLRKTPDARIWLDKFNHFLSIYGNRVVAAHLDITTPTWKEDSTPVLDTIKSYYARIDSGWDFYKAKGDVKVHREKAIKDFKSKLKDEGEKAQFRKMLKAAQGVYAFQEDHGFYIDQGSTAALRNAIIACGKRLFRRNLIESIEDVSYLTFHELVEIMEALIYNEKISKYHYGALVPNLVRERKEDARLSADADAPLTFGNIPEKMTDPIGIKVFGIIDDILHPKGEKEVEERLEGFPGAPGVVEGPARVIVDYKDFQKVKAGEILVCPYTGTAWTPLFVKIGGVVTDTGGMLTHAAIAAREYGIPAVVGTWNATNSINDGDTIKIDGNVGIVEVIERAKTG
jgi:pyruvate,water dikinase